METSTQIHSIDEQIAQLTRQKQALLDQTRSSDLEICKRLIQQYGFSKSELGFIGKAGTLKNKASDKGAKYVNPNNKAQTWSGRGRQPGWMKAALTKGMTAEQLLIQPGA